MTKQINFKIEEYIIANFEQNDNGVNYKLSNETTSVTLETVYYSPVYNFIINNYGTHTFTIGKKISLISDDKRLLALKSENGEMCFISDYKNENGIMRYFENDEYILEKYDLTKEDFLNLAKKEILSKTLN